MKFLPLDQGKVHVSSDAVAQITRNGCEYTFLDRGGVVLGKMPAEVFNQCFHRTYLSAAPGTTAVHLAGSAGEPDKVCIKRLPVVGWCIDTGDHSAQPIVPDLVMNGSMLAVELPDGSLIEHTDDYTFSYSTLEEAIRECRRRARHMATKFAADLDE